MVTLGAHYIDQVESTQQKIYSVSITIHPNFNPQTLQNNVALIKLAYAATINGFYQLIEHQKQSINVFFGNSKRFPCVPGTIEHKHYGR